MTRRLGRKDTDTVLGLVGREPSLNVWLIADLETNGFETDDQELWGAFSGTDLRAVVLRYHGHFVVYSLDPRLPDDMLELLSTPLLRTLSGSARTVDEVAKHLRFSSIVREDLAELTSTAFRPSASPGVAVCRAGVGDAMSLHALSGRVTEFAAGAGRVEDVRAILAGDRTRTWVVRCEGRVVSTASTNVECSGLAMIGGVMTDPDHRGRGYAAACMSRLCGELLAEGKVCCLTYHNPVAGRVYSRLGFRVVSPWLVCTA